MKGARHRETLGIGLVKMIKESQYNAVYVIKCAIISIKILLLF